MLMAVSVALIHCASAAPPSETHITPNAAKQVLEMMQHEENDFTAEQMGQLRQLNRYKRSFGGMASPFAIIFKILRKILGLPRDADPIIILLAIISRILGIQDEFETLAVSVGLLSSEGGNGLL